MPTVIVNYGETRSSTHEVEEGEYLFVNAGGAIMVPEAVAIDMEGGSAVIAGQVFGGTPIYITEGYSNVTVTPTGQVFGATVEPSSFSEPAIDGAGGMAQIELVNSGYIGVNNGTAIDLGNSFDRVSNYGIIQGYVDLGGGDDDFLVGGGEVRGIVFGGDGDDYLSIEHIDPGSSILRFYGDAGIDVLDVSEFASAVWIDLDYTGTNVWTRDDRDLSSGAWRQLADARLMETVVGSPLSDYLSGDNGNNSFFYIGGLDVVRGDGGTDTLAFPSVGVGVWVDLDFSGYEAWQLVQGEWRPIADVFSIENLTGSFFGDTLIGDNAHNVFDPFNGDDIVNGEGGNDRMIWSSDTSPGFDRFDGGSGTDVVDFSSKVNPVWVDLGASDGKEAWSRGFTLAVGDWIYEVDLANVEDVIGTAQGDYLRGDSAINWLQGGLGDDTLVYTAGGMDFLWGDGGTDTADFTQLGFGVWVSLQYSGFEAWRNGVNTALADLKDIETVSGSGYNDYLAGNTLNNILRGNYGNDTLSGGLGQDTLEGGAGADTFVYASLLEASNQMAFNGVNYIATGFDVLTDFVFGTDKIDLRAIPDANSTVTGNQDFVWSASGAAGTVTWGAIAGGYVGLLLYVDANAGADYLIYSANQITSGDVLLV